MSHHESDYEQCTYVLVGGGLQSGLLACSILHHQPAARITLLERGERIGGNHTWCFHSGDLPQDAAHLASLLTEHAWDGYQVAFPGLSRRVDLPYRCLSSAHLHGVLHALAESTGRLSLRLGVEATEAAAHHVRLRSGEEIPGEVIVDARGPECLSGLRCMYQKFVGLEVALEAPSGLEAPVLMDACVPQHDGFRFFYVLPFSPLRLLIEDTRFSETSHLDVAHFTEEVREYAAAAGWRIREVLRTESGVLPMPCAGAPPEQASPPLLGGYRGGWFHPATGYSLPVAARLAEYVARHPGPLEGPEWSTFQARHRRQYQYAALLNALLLKAFEPGERYRVFERFYCMDKGRIERFYALQLTPGDRLRMFAGRPPRGISLLRALREGTG